MEAIPDHCFWFDDSFDTVVNLPVELGNVRQAQPAIAV